MRTLDATPDRVFEAWDGSRTAAPKIDPDHPEEAPVITILLTAVGDKTEMILQLALPSHLSDEQVRDWLDTGMRAGWGETIDRLVDYFAGVDVRT